MFASSKESPCGKNPGKSDILKLETNQNARKRNASRKKTKINSTKKSITVQIRTLKL